MKPDMMALANKIARSKKFLDDMGKKSGEDAKKKIEAAACSEQAAADGEDFSIKGTTK